MTRAQQLLREMEELLKGGGRRGEHNKLPGDVLKTDSRGRKYYGPPEKPKGEGRRRRAAEDGERPPRGGGGRRGGFDPEGGHGRSSITPSLQHIGGALAHDSDAFRHASDEVGEAATKVLLAAITKAPDVETLQRVRQAIGRGQFTLGLDHLEHADLRRVLRNFGHRARKIMDADENDLREAISDLAEGKDPSIPTRAKRPRKQKGGEEEHQFGRSMGAKPRRLQEEDEG